MSQLFLVLCLATAFWAVEGSRGSLTGLGGQFFARPEYRPQNVINSLLTGVSPVFPRQECFTSADNRAGLCMAKTACVTSGGIIAGTCGIMGACCIYQGTCRAVVNANETYFVSPSFPNLSQDRLDPPVCIFTLQRNNLIQKWPICQIRLDFDEFSLAPPINGTCGGQTDSFVISGASNFNVTGLPETGICGDLSGQHMYINVDPDDTSEPLLLVVNTGNEYPYTRKWSVRVRQVPCISAFKAPPGCLQYYTTSTGTVESFNLRGMNRGRPAAALGGNGFQNFNPNQGNFNQNPNQPLFLQGSNLLPNPNYFNKMNYGVCIAQQPKACGIQWDALEFDFGGGRADVSGTGYQTNTNFGCTRMINGPAGTTTDDGDYVVIVGGSMNGVSNLENIFCGQRLSWRADRNENEPIISFFKPFVMFVKTDTNGLNPLNGAQNQKGFQINYKLLPCV